MIKEYREYTCAKCGKNKTTPCIIPDGWANVTLMVAMSDESYTSCSVVRCPDCRDEVDALMIGEACSIHGQRQKIW